MELRTAILSDLVKHKEMGILQSEIESHFGFSRAHVSETLSILVSEGKVIERMEGRLLKRVWLTEFYPYPISGTIRIAMLASSEYVPFLASALSVCTKNKITLRFRILKSSYDVMDSLISGSTEIALAPFYSQIVYSIVTRKIKILSSIASGGSSVFTNEESLQGNIGTSDTSTMILLSRTFMKTLEKNVEVYDDPHSAIASFENGKFKFITTWEPFCTVLRKKGKYMEPLKYEEALGDIPCCASSYRLNASAAERKLFGEIVNEYGKLIEGGMASTKLGEAIEIMSKEMGIQQEIISESLKSYRFLEGVDRELLMRYMDVLKIPVSMSSIEDMFP
ncbi:MAG: hypothetical protein B2I17_07440 [Thermoplasmatales archaeon B_DKE]|nr:MAG: hypothetical protein B2I17_07440 [Thermoplasmatales archaeon B_DKE]